MSKRILALIIKEFLTLFRDPKGRMLLIGPPLMQLVVFSFAVTLEVKNVSVAVFNQDRGKHSYEILQRLHSTDTFTHITFVDNGRAVRSLIDQQTVMVAMTIPQDFSRNLEAGRVAKIQLILDGRRSNAAQIVNGYISQIISTYERELLAARGFTHPIKPVTRHWFNQNLLYLWFTFPSLIGILAMLITLIVTALSVARERELGTFDQLLVSPLMPYEILLGKMVPAVLIGIAEGMIIFTVGVLFFGVPFTGSLLLLLFALFVFVMSIVGIGLFMSALCKTQQQAILGAFVFMVPATTLSGYAAPIENMPPWLQTASWINPLRHFLVIVKGLFLKASPFMEVWRHIWPLLIIGALTLSLAGWFFAKRLE
jgi:drug efflux transport system permease protein